MNVKNILNNDGPKLTSCLFLILILSLAYSMMLTIGPMIAEQNTEFELSQLLPFVLRLMVSIIINYFIFIIAPRLKLCSRAERICNYFEKLRNYRYLFLIIWAFIFLSWIPAYLLFYPSILSYDIISQTYSAFGTITNNHHPILHTWLIRFFLQFGMSLFSSYESGLGLMSLFQMLLLSYALTRMVFLLKKKNIHMFIVLLTALLSAVWFTNACLSISIVKDNLHAAFLLLFACHFTEIVTEPSEYLSRKRNLILFPIISFLMCAFRNNGIHIYVFCFLFLLILRITQIKKCVRYISLIVTVILPILMYAIYTGPVLSALDITKGEVREALSIPIQQISRVAVNKADELTEEQVKRMDYYIDNLNWMNPSPGRAYDPFLADPAKSTFYSAHYDADPFAFWKFYIQTGKQFSKEYVMAFFSNTLGFWYPGYFTFSYVECNNYAAENFVKPLERKSVWEPQFLSDYYESVCYSSCWRQTPVIRVFFVQGFSFWFLLYGLALSWRKRGFFKNVLPIFLPLIGHFGIMLLSPMSSYRYAWPLFLMLPIIFIGVTKNQELVKPGLLW